MAVALIPAPARARRTWVIGVVVLILVVSTAAFGAVRWRRGPDYPPATPADLVLIGQGQHRLVPDARAKFLAWQSSFGTTIWITDSWRSPEQQAQCRIEKPTLCATPAKSWHVKGRAVDVDLPKMGVASVDDATYRRLKATAKANGWCRTNPKEPWHFSAGGCG